MKKKRNLILSVFIGLNAFAWAQPAQRTFLPPTMGWSSWNTFALNISEKIIEDQADAMVKTGLKAAGYEYINIDDGFWNGRGKDGQLIINRERFPNGMRVVADYIHKLGLKAGMYSDAGDDVCGSRSSTVAYGIGVGLAGYEEQDIKTYLQDWDYDFIKVDYCGGMRMGLDEREQYTKISNIIKEIEKKNKILITTLTKRMAEDLTEYMKEVGIRVRYLHSDIDTLERAEIIRDMRLDKFDVLVGINLLREGLDIPEITLVAILDADKEGFLRSETSLIQTIGRAARNSDGHVIMYADNMTDSMKAAIDETYRRRGIQEAYNKEHGITPTTIKKAVRDLIAISKAAESVSTIDKDVESMDKAEINKLIKELEKKMFRAAAELDFENAALLRDKISELRANL